MFNDIVDYWIVPNEFDSVHNTLVLSCLFLNREDYKNTELKQTVVENVLSYFNKMPQNPSKDQVKQLKNFLEDEWKYIASPNNSYKQSNIKTVDNVLKSKLDETLKRNLVHSMLRWAEWYMLPERDLEQLNLELQYTPLKINALDLSDIPYNKDIDLTGDLKKDFELHYKSIRKYATKNNIDMNKVNPKSMSEALDIIERWVKVAKIEEVPENYRPLITMWKQIRKNSYKAANKFYKIMKNGFEVKDLSRSSARALSDSEPVCKDICEKLGFSGHITNVIDNIFHFKFEIDGKSINVPITSGQINLSACNMLFASASIGLGPAMKERIVFNIASALQQLLEPFASLLKEIHKNSYNHAYLDQTAFTHANVKDYTDVMCTDYSGYSDWANRDGYKWLMKLFGFPDDIIEVIMTLISLPIKLADGLHEVKFGSLQGIKFVVFIMNDLNALIGLIGDIIKQNKYVYRVNCGDDEYEATKGLDQELLKFGLKEVNKYTEEDLNIILSVALMFNCPTNMSKTAWLQRDGFWDFCKMFYGFKGEPLTGIPPKLYGKQILFIRQISEIYKVAERAQLIDYMVPIEDFYTRLSDYLNSQLTLGMRLPSNSELTLDRKLQIAKGISYKIGGLSSCDPDIEERIKHLVNYANVLFNDYEFKPSQTYTIMSKLQPQGVIGEYFLNVDRNGIESYLDIVTRLDNIIKSYKTGSVIVDDISKIEDDLEKYTRVVVDGKPVGSTSGSTYHRSTPKRDQDISIVEYNFDISVGVPFKVPTTLKDVITLKNCLEDDNYTELTNIQRFYAFQVLKRKLEPEIKEYTSLPSRYHTCFEVVDKRDNTIKKLRISCKYMKRDKDWFGFIPLSEYTQQYGKNDPKVLYINFRDKYEAIAERDIEVLKSNMESVLAHQLRDVLDSTQLIMNKDLLLQDVLEALGLRSINQLKIVLARLL